MMTANNEPEILTVKQAAQFLQVSHLLVYRLIRAGAIKAGKFGKFWRISKAEILRACNDLGPGKKDVL